MTPIHPFRRFHLILNNEKNDIKYYLSYSSSEVRSDSLILSSRDADWSRPGIIDDHAYLDDPGRPSFSERSL